MTPTSPSSPARRRLRLGPAALFFLLPLAVFVFSSLPGINGVLSLLALVLVGLLLVLRFLPRVARPLRATLWVLLVLSLVGATGWFFSPFFFALYLVAIGLGFLYTPGVAIAFTLALIAMFASSIGEVSATHDFLVLLSLLSVIPIVMALRRSFLLVQQEKKEILILEEEGAASGITSLEAILKNQVNRLSILLRQPATYLKQGLALLSAGKLTEKEFPEVLTRMRRAVDELFTLVKEFESGVTKHLLLGRKPPPPPGPPPRP